MTPSSYKDRKYHIEEYNPSWADEFIRDKKLLSNIWKEDAVAIEHIGSTSVPGMRGKPTIDILILVNDLNVISKHIKDMQNAGYESIPALITPDSHLFRKMHDNVLLSNVHVFQKGHPHVREMLALRDYLRTHSETVKEYSEIKQKLALAYPNDYAQYRKEKDEYMNKLERKIGIIH